MSWACPKCGGTLLKVAVHTSAHLTQESDGNFQTEVEGDHEWDDESRMTCEECDISDMALNFEVHEPVNVDYDPAQFRIMDRDDLYFLLSLAAQELDNTKEGDGHTEGRLAMERQFERARDEIQCPSRHVTISGMCKS